MDKFGRIKIKLKDVLDASGMSKNALSYRAQVQHTQLNRYYRDEVTRLDTDVLARFCTALHCDISDLLEYIPPEPEEQGEA